MFLIELMSNTALGVSDGMDGLIKTGEGILAWLQRGAGISAAIAFCIGGYYLIWGGEAGRQKSIKWFVGGAFGLIIVLGAAALSKGVSDNIKFSFVNLLNLSGLC